MNSVILCYFVLLLVGASITAPAFKQIGESTSLTCDYDLEGSRLYSVKWYRDNEEFYRYMPRLRPPQHAHTLEGIKVDLEKSSARRVHLRDLTLRSRGLYRCEVSEEAPSFHSAQVETFMEVYYFPRDSPKITGLDRRYAIGDPLAVNCTSAASFPAPNLQWVVDGQKVKDTSWLVTYEPQAVPKGLMVAKLGLCAPARQRMKLRCIVSISNHRREKTVVLEYPHNGAHLLTSRQRARWKVHASKTKFMFPHQQSKLVKDTSWLVTYEPQAVPKGLMVAKLGLCAPARQRMKLRCIVSISNHRREKTVVLDVSSGNSRKCQSNNLLLILVLQFLLIQSYIRYFYSSS